MKGTAVNWRTPFSDRLMIFPSEMLLEDMLDLDAGIFQKSPGTLASRKPLSSFQLISYLFKTIL